MGSPPLPSLPLSSSPLSASSLHLSFSLTRRRFTRQRRWTWRHTHLLRRTSASSLSLFLCLFLIPPLLLSPLTHSSSFGSTFSTFPFDPSLASPPSFSSPLLLSLPLAFLR